MLKIIIALTTVLEIITVLANANGDEWTNYQCSSYGNCSNFGLRGAFDCDMERGLCKCIAGSKHLESAYACHFARGIGENCTLELDCKIHRSTCMPKQNCPSKDTHDCIQNISSRCPCERVCQCKEGTEMDKNSERCVKKCKTCEECGENEECKDHTCQCKRHHEFDIVDKKCLPMKCNTVCDCPLFNNSRNMFKCEKNFCTNTTTPNLEADKICRDVGNDNNKNQDNSGNSNRYSSSFAIIPISIFLAILSSTGGI
uniref:Putative secreted protein n=1 Tax=Xenopsylla cheopis TaxID=163159 RepID=A0A6M2DYN8_XENCH